ncbi:uncharacterized protein BN783_01617 [Odoribacter sp. CAG:788]|nr:uncharacterized protein BN783_01617 [Odoribacter sp. CAG:788]
MKKYVSESWGKDSLAMLLMMIERGETPDEVVFYDTGVEFKAIYDTRDKVLPILASHGIKYTELQPEQSFIYNMLDRLVNERSGGTHYGYSWCGGVCRWGTSQKIKALKAHTFDGLDYVGIAYDEPHRLTKNYRPNKRFFLYDNEVTEADALQYCYDRGFYWEENGIKLYEILDRVSCWCCGNKNLKELKNIFLYLPEYWERLKALQSRTERPYRRREGITIHQLEKRFINEINKRA